MSTDALNTQHLYICNIILVISLNIVALLILEKKYNEVHFWLLHHTPQNNSLVLTAVCLEHWIGTRSRTTSKLASMYAGVIMFSSMSYYIVILVSVLNTTYYIFNHTCVN